MLLHLLQRVLSSRVKPRHCCWLKSQSLDVYFYRMDQDGISPNRHLHHRKISQGYPKSLETAKKQTIHLGRAKKAVVFSKQPATWLAGLAACLTFRAMQNEDVTKRDQLSDRVQAGLFDASVLYFVLPSKSDGYMAHLQRPNTDNKIEYKLVNSMQVRTACKWVMVLSPAAMAEHFCCMFYNKSKD